jgi:hypothetical protein
MRSSHCRVRRWCRRKERVAEKVELLIGVISAPVIILAIDDLREEYREAHPEGYGYSRFCDLFREFERRLSPVMRQDHAAGDKVFVDYSGKKIDIVDRATGVVREAEIFVAVLGASSFTYAEATLTQTLPDWIGAHVRMFRFFGGVPRLIVPDNLKSGVNKASFYDPEINRSYGMMPATPLMDPFVEDVMQQDVGQKRTDARSLRRPPFRLVPLIALENAGLEPLPD